MDSNKVNFCCAISKLIICLKGICLKDWWSWRVNAWIKVHCTALSWPGVNRVNSIGENIKTQASSFSAAYWVRGQRQLTVPSLEKQQEESCSKTLLCGGPFHFASSIATSENVLPHSPRTINTTLVYEAPELKSARLSDARSYKSIHTNAVKFTAHWRKPLQFDSVRMQQQRNIAFVTGTVSFLHAQEYIRRCLFRGASRLWMKAILAACSIASAAALAVTSELF